MRAGRAIGGDVELYSGSSIQPELCQVGHIQFMMPTWFVMPLPQMIMHLGTIQDDLPNV